MSVPQGPADLEQRNIIDKLADFVARNGTEFESLTKDKQRNNPKFAFLHGGEYFDYYTYRVEEARKRWQQMRPYKDPSQQGIEGGFQWGHMGDQGPNNPHWEQMGNGTDQWQRFNAPSHGWAGPDSTWFPKPPWVCGPPPRMQPPPPAYPFHPPDASDSFQRGYNNPPQFGFPGHQASFPSQSYAYGSESFRNSGVHTYQQSGTSELGEADIEQSEKNLKAQHESLMARQEMEVHELLDAKREESVRKLGEKFNMPWEQMNEVIQPLIEACTKENISKGKSWVVEKMAESPELTRLMSEYLIARASLQNVSFDLRLHLVYLLNDLLHHCKRRGAPIHLQESLHYLVPILFCLANELADDEQKAKINRVLNLWETNSYLPTHVLSKMKSPEMEKFLNEWKDGQAKLYEAEVEEIRMKIKNQYCTLEQQHQEFAEHVRRQLSSSHSDNPDELRSDNYATQLGSSHRPQNVASKFTYWIPPSHPTHSYDTPHPDMIINTDNREKHRRNLPPTHSRGFLGNTDAMGSGYPPMGWSGGQGGPPPNWNQGVRFPPPTGSGCPGSVGAHREVSISVYVEGEEPEEEQSNFEAENYERSKKAPYDSYFEEYNQYNEAENDTVDDRSNAYRNHRPSRFSSAEGTHENIDEPKDYIKQSISLEFKTDVEQVPPEKLEPFDPDPKCEPWQLPAGLMHSLIKLKDFDFVPIDGKKLQLIPPVVPSERLLMAIENFYMPPSHDRTRDGEGWERLGLYEFYSKKEACQNLGKSEKNNTFSDKTGNRRRRENSGESGVSTPSESDSKSEMGIKQEDNIEEDQPFSRDDSGYSSRLGPPQLSYLTAYPKGAIGQTIRTGVEALTLAPPPMQCMQGQLTQNYAAYKTVGSQPAVGSGGLPIPTISTQPGLLPALGAPPTAPPGFPNTNFLQFPPPIPPAAIPTLSQPPPPIPFSQNLIQRPPPGYSTERSRFDSRRSRSQSRSDSRSKSRSHSEDSHSHDFRSRSGSHSGSQSPRSRSGSRSCSRSESVGSRSPRSRSNSHSRSGSPAARFTSAPGPGGVGSGSNPSNTSNLNAARAAAMAAAASIANSLNTSQPPPSWAPGGNIPNSHNAPGVFGAPPLMPGPSFGECGGMGPFVGNYPPGPPSRGIGGLRGFGPAGRGGGMRFHGSNQDERFHQQSRDYQHR